MANQNPKSGKPSNKDWAAKKPTWADLGVEIQGKMKPMGSNTCSEEGMLRRKKILALIKKK